MKKLLFLLAMILTFPVFSQNPASKGTFVEMADKLREDGKIWVVVAVIFIIVFGLLIYIIALDKKIGKIEREVNQNKK